MVHTKPQIHLPPENYRGRRIYFVTICTHCRLPIFADHREGRWALKHLQSAAARHDFLLHEFCAMPDHLHFLAEGTTGNSNLISFTDRFKQYTGFGYRQRHAAILWQKRFHDYILRRGDVIEDVAVYIWMNPVRKQLCDGPDQYPLSGSQTIAWMKVQKKEPPWQPPWPHARAM